MGDCLQRSGHYHSQGRDALFRQEHQVDASQRNILSVQPRVLEFRAWIRGGGRRQGIRAQNFPVANVEVVVSCLGDGSGPLFVFGGHRQAYDNNNDDRGDKKTALVVQFRNLKDIPFNRPSSIRTGVLKHTPSI